MVFNYLLFIEQDVCAGVPIFVEHWGGIICNFTPILPYFQHWGDAVRPLLFSREQIKWRPKKSLPKIEEFLLPE